MLWGCREGKLRMIICLNNGKKEKFFFMGESCLDFKQRVLNAVQTILVSDKVTLCWAIMHCLIIIITQCCYSIIKTTKDSILMLMIVKF